MNHGETKMTDDKMPDVQPLILNDESSALMRDVRSTLRDHPQAKDLIPLVPGHIRQNPGLIAQYARLEAGSESARERFVRQIIDDLTPIEGRTMSDQVEKVESRLTQKGNLRMWGQLYVSKAGRTVGGWLVDSWSERSAPYWQPKMHWFDRKESKLLNVRFDINFGRSSMNIFGEDQEIEPERAKFIRATVEQWEREWLEAQAKKP